MKKLKVLIPLILLLSLGASFAYGQSLQTSNENILEDPIRPPVKNT